MLYINKIVPYERSLLVFDEMHKLSQTCSMLFSPPGFFDKNLGRMAARESQLQQSGKKQPQVHCRYTKTLQT